MPVQVTNVSQAFQLLCEVVRDSYSSGRICLGAPLKLELQRRTHRAFNEQVLGFQRFGDFLRAAQGQGLIQLLRTPGGDLEVRLANDSRNSPNGPVLLSIPASVAPAQTASTLQPTSTATPDNFRTQPTDSYLPGNSPQVRIRQDLWDAFNSSFGNWAYDRRTDAAHKAPPNLFGPAATNPDLVEIPAGRERTVGWMRSFAAMQDDQTKTRLLGVLDGDSAQYNFMKTVGMDWKLRRAWRRYHIQQVLAAIEAWATANNLHPQRVATPYIGRTRVEGWFGRAPNQSYVPRMPQNQVMPPAPTIPQSPAAVPAAPLSLQGGLSSRLETLIDQLIDELLRLRGALCVISAKQ
jgi:hypothetical protein